MTDDFNVITYQITSNEYTHWADGLKMVITKDGVTIMLNEEEIKQIVRSLPRTLGGTYGV